MSGPFVAASIRDEALNNPAEKVVAVSPNDSTDIPTTKGIYIGGAGHFRFNDAFGNDVEFNNAVAGYHPLRFTRVYATTLGAGTDASDIFALY